MTTINTPKPNRLLRENTQAIIVDVQQAFAPHIYKMDELTTKIAILVQGLQVLGLPVMLNEQYPKGLGATVTGISEVLNDDNKRVFEKSEFSVCDSAPSWNHLAKQNRNNVIVCGIEAHICVQQTVLDLLDNGMQPVLIADAVSSRSTYDRDLAINRMRHAGAVVTSVEGILFEMCRSSKDPAFKVISNLVK